MKKDGPANLIAIVPEAGVQAMIGKGFRSTDRSNGRTVTMFRWIPEGQEAAMQEGRKLKCIWAVESAQ